MRISLESKSANKGRGGSGSHRSGGPKVRSEEAGARGSSDGETDFYCLGSFFLSVILKDKKKLHVFRMISGVPPHNLFIYRFNNPGLVEKIFYYCKVLLLRYSAAGGCMDGCLTLQETAEYLGVDDRHIYYLAEMGYLEGWKIRSSWRFYKGVVDYYARGTDQKRINKKPSGNHDY